MFRFGTFGNISFHMDLGLRLDVIAFTLHLFYQVINDHFSPYPSCSGGCADYAIVDIFIIVMTD